MDNYYTPQEIAEKFKVKINTVYKWIREGKLKAIKVGDLWRISESEIKHFIEDNN